jgi:hypothetical protein
VRRSTGSGTVERYIGRHGAKRVAGAVFVAAVLPIMLKSATNPEAFPNGRIVGAWLPITKASVTEEQQRSCVGKEDEENKDV